MNKSSTKFFANLIFFAHLVLILIILFGWYFSAIKYLYLVALVLTLASELIFGYCILTRWEFELRQKLNPDLNYNYSFASYYANKYLGLKVSEKLVRYLTYAFLIGSLIIFYARA